LKNSRYFMRYTPPAQPAHKLPATFARPMMEMELAATAAGRLQSLTSPGRWVTRNAMWKPQVKKPACRHQ
jgi:hypothetical protein